jgi:uncharacterized NAD-dependent epimerase/dehydratase family protein
MQLPKPYLLFLGDVASEPYAKTAFGLRDWVPDDVEGQYRLSDCQVDLGIADMTPAQAASSGVKSLLIGVAPVGGEIPAKWIPALVAALESGLDLVSGMHGRLAAIPEIRAAAEKHRRALFDVRHHDAPIPIATGAKRPGKRLLTVGTDCALGKKYTALALTQEMTARGCKATFRATGQTGIMIAGEGIAIDAVVSDFVAGAAEIISPANQPDHWDMIEGQGALFHPAYAGVTLGLLHGSQPDALVLCHDPTRTHVAGYPDFKLPDIDAAMDLYLRHAMLTNPAAKFVGISLNTSKLQQDEYDRVVENLRTRFALPCVDPLRDGCAAIADRLLAI